MNNIKALVTGGSGYFGSLLIKKLYSKGYIVGNLDINAPDHNLDNVAYHNCDIRDEDLLKKYILNYDIVFHNVAQVPLAKDKKLFYQVNENGTYNLCQVLYGHNKKLIYTSSSAVFGIPKNNPVNENTTPIPCEAYGKSKYNAEKICYDFSKKGLPVSIIRPRTIIGHGRLGIFSILFKWINEGINIPVLNNGNNIYQFVHADDLADACILASEQNEKFSVYNIGSAEFSTMRNTLQSLCDYANTGSRVYSLPLKPVEIGMNIFSKLGLIPLGPYHSLMYGRSIYFDIKKAQNKLGYKPKYSVDTMFRESYDWYINNINSLPKNNKSIHKSSPKESFLILVKLFSKYFT